MIINILIIVLCIAADQLTKICAAANLKDISTLPIIENIFHFTYVENRGAAFGMLADRFEKGQYGVKTAAGFYDYAGGKDAEKIKYRDRMFTKISKCLFNS